jgi:predicted amidohydrolase
MVEPTISPFKTAACHAASVFLDTEQTIDKAYSLIGEAARNGAHLIVFPEAFVPAFPLWAALQAPILSHEIFKRLASQAVRITYVLPPPLPRHLFGIR